MKSLAFVLLMVFVPVLCKESLQEFEKYLSDPEIIALVKRLGAGLDNSDSSRSSSDSFLDPAAGSAQPLDSGDGLCSKKSNSNTIIQTKISLSHGATFISSQHRVSDAELCSQQCCETDGCDVSVYQDKDDRACYLFKCKDDDTGENKCAFSDHPGYYSIFVSKSLDEASSEKEAPEETALNALKSSHIKAPVTSTVKPTTVTYHPHSVGNGGACVVDLNCEDIHAECRARTCQCRAGYEEKHGQCRKQCGQEEFRCVEPGTAVAGPDCIPRSQFCDGQAQCGDGSDEINCPTTSHRPGSAMDAHREGGTPAAPATGTRLDEADADRTGTGSVKTPNPDRLAGPAADSQHPKPQDSAAETDTDQDTKEGDTVEAGDGDGSKLAPAEGDSASSNDEDALPADSKDSSSSSSETGGEGGGPVQAAKPEKSSNATASTAAPAGPSPAHVSKTESVEFVERVSLIQAYTTKGPIIALSLGLCFTVILLIFVGCRLRNVRRRLRKGRPLHSNEADYLINGMYL